MSDHVRDPLPRADEVVAEATLFATDDGTTAAVQIRAVTIDGQSVGFNIDADTAPQLAAVLRNAGRRARRLKAMYDAGNIR